MTIKVTRAESILDINKAITASIHLDEVLQTIIDKSTEVLQLDTGAIYLVENQQLFLGATTPPLPVDFPEFLRHDNISNHSHIQESLNSGIGIFVNNTSEEFFSETEQAVVKARNLKSILYIPLTIENKPVGVMILGTMTDFRIFRTEDLVLYASYCSHAALSIENAKLYKNSLALIDELKIQNLEFQKINRELKAAREEAVNNEKRFSSIFNISPEPISVVEMGSGKFLMANEAFLKETGFKREEVINHTSLDMDVWISATDRSNWAGKLLNEGKLRSYEVQFRTRKNGIRDYLVSSDLIEIEGKQFSINIYIDITERKIFEKELYEAKVKAEESDRLKTAFLQNMSHEIRTPLNAICGFSGILNRPELTADQINGYTAIIQNSSDQLLSVVTDILTISSLETRQVKINLASVNINALILDLVSMFTLQASNQNISLYSKQELTDREAEVFTDRTKITQILTNLISNALKFTYEGFIEFGYHLRDKKLLFYVKDSGIGIKADQQDRIFDRFCQADLTINKKYGGTGLGLSISKGFVELLGGEIWVESEFGVGSTFFFTIPFNPVFEIVKNGTASEKISYRSTILIAEDEEMNYLYLEILLKGEKIRVLHAKDGREAVEMCKAEPEIDLVLMDIKMPVMDGLTAARKIKEFNPSLPILAYSAYAMQQEQEKYAQVFDEYLTKPVNENIFRMVIEKYQNLK